MSFDWKKGGLFAAGVLFGTAGIRLLTSRDAKKVYTHCTAAFLRAKRSVMDTAELVQENCEDIYEDARRINEEIEAEDEIFGDLSEEIPEAVEAAVD